MKKYVQHTVLFVLISLTFITFVDHVVKNSVRDKADFTIEQSTKYAVFGHSHPECAFDESLIDNFQNFSASGEAYFYTYQKIKNIIKHNPQLETVFVEFSNNQISDDKDGWTWDDKYITNRFPIFSAFADASDHKVLLKNNYNGYANSLSVGLRSNLTMVLQNDFSFIPEMGGFQALHRDKLDSILTAYKEFPEEIEHFSGELSEVNLKYLRMCVDVCAQFDKKIVFVRTPQHPVYEGFELEGQFFNVLRNQFADVHFLDFNDFKMSDSEYADLGHLNFKGAERFSIHFNDLMKKTESESF